MSGAVPQKIVLKSTTKISLNDRFSTIQKTKPPVATVPQVRSNMAAAQQASAKNRRLAQQMANRPTVIAALKLKKRSMKQRLGVKSRLTLNTPQTVQAQVRGRGRARGRGTSLQRGGVQKFNQQQFQRGGRNQVFQQRGTSPRRALRGRGGALRGRGTLRGRGSLTPTRASRGRGTVVFTRGGRRGQSFGAGGRGNRGRGFYNFRGQRPNTRGNWRGRGAQRGGRGRGRGRGQKPTYSKEDLDNQLEAYMSKTKGHLDAELDAYMAQSNAGGD